MNESRLLDLIDAHLDGRQTEREHAELEAALRESEQWRAVYWEYALQHATVHQVLTEKVASSAVTPAHARSASRRATARRRVRRVTSLPAVRYATIALAAAAAIFVVVSVFSAPGTDAPPPRRIVAVTTEPHTPPSVAPTAPATTPVVTPTPATAPAPSAPGAPQPAVTPLVPAPTPPAPVVPTAPAPPIVQLPPPGPKPGTNAGLVRVAYLDEVEGDVQRHGKAVAAWGNATAGAPLFVGDSLRTKYSRARVVFESGSVLHLNRFTTLAFAPLRPTPVVEMVGGEVFVEIEKKDAGFAVDTPHGSAVDLGTRFGVVVKPAGTTVVVVEGSVAASTDNGEARVGGRQQVLLARRTSPPGRIQEARDLERRFTWTEFGSRRRTVSFTDAFDASPAGAWPRGWIKHTKDAMDRGHFVVRDEPGVRPNRVLACVGQPEGTTQHAIVPFTGWSSGFTLRYRMRLTGKDQARAGIEVWSTTHVGTSVEYDAQNASLNFGANDAGTWRILAKAPVVIPTGTWVVVQIEFTTARTRVWVDGKPFLDERRSVSGRVDQVSLISRGRDTAEFDDVVARPRPKR